jgi:hypothetical protein
MTEIADGCYVPEFWTLGFSINTRKESARIVRDLQPPVATDRALLSDDVAPASQGPMKVPGPTTRRVKCSRSSSRRSSS